METHTKEFRGSHVWYPNLYNVVKFLRQSCRMEESFTEEEIQEAWCAVATNAHECYAPSRKFITGIFPVAGAFMAHNCIANTSYSFDEFWMIARATVPVKRGESLFMSYTNVIKGTKERRANLRENKFFECNCARCSDPTEC